MPLLHSSHNFVSCRRWLCVDSVVKHLCCVHSDGWSSSLGLGEGQEHDGCWGENVAGITGSIRINNTSGVNSPGLRFQGAVCLVVFSHRAPQRAAQGSSHQQLCLVSPRVCWPTAALPSGCSDCKQSAWGDPAGHCWRQPHCVQHRYCSQQEWSLLTPLCLRRSRNIGRVVWHLSKVWNKTQGICLFVFRCVCH